MNKSTLEIYIKFIRILCIYIIYLEYVKEDKGTIYKSRLEWYWMSKFNVLLKIKHTKFGN